MSTLQVREVPEDVRQTLKARALAAGQSLSEYVLGELTRSARQPTVAELTARIQARSDAGGPRPTTPAAEILRAERQGPRR